MAGSAVPDLELPDADGNPRRLSELVGGDPTLLHFYRGWWCPKERAYFRVLVDLQDELEVAHTRMVSDTEGMLVPLPAPTGPALERYGGAPWPFDSFPS